MLARYVTALHGNTSVERCTAHWLMHASSDVAIRPGKSTTGEPSTPSDPRGKSRSHSRVKRSVGVFDGVYVVPLSEGQL